MQRFYGKSDEQKATHLASSNQISSLKVPCSSSCAEIVSQGTSIKHTIFYDIIILKIKVREDVHFAQMHLKHFY